MYVDVVSLRVEAESVACMARWSGSGVDDDYANDVLDCDDGVRALKNGHLRHCRFQSPPASSPSFSPSTHTYAHRIFKASKVETHSSKSAIVECGARINVRMEGIDLTD